MELLHSGPEGQLNVVSGVVCLVDDDDLVGRSRGQRDRGSKLTYTIAYRIKETTFVRSIDNNVRGTNLLTQCFSYSSLAHSCSATQQQVRQFTLIDKTLKNILDAVREDTIFNNVWAVFLHPQKFFTHSRGLVNDLDMMSSALNIICMYSTPFLGLVCSPHVKISHTAMPFSGHV